MANIVKLNYTADEINEKLGRVAEVVQTTGDSEMAVMSQKATTEAIAEKTEYNNIIEEDITSNLTIESGFHYSNGLKKVTQSGMSCTNLIGVKEGDKFKITATYGYITPLVAEFDNSQTMISYHLFESSGTVQAVDYNYTVPSGVSYIAVNNRAQSRNPTKVITCVKDTVKHRIEANKECIDSITEAIKSASTFSVLIQLGNINNCGIITSNATGTITDDFIPVISGNTFYVIAEGTSRAYFTVYYYTSLKTQTSSSAIYAKNINSNNVVNELTIPNDVAYIKLSSLETSTEYKVGVYYTYYDATTVEDYVEPSYYVDAEKVLENGKPIDLSDAGISARLEADAQSVPDSYIVPEYEYQMHMVDALRKEISQLRDYVSKLHEPTILDSGACGENLTWALYSDGLLKISGTGRSYDYCKGVLIGKTRAEIESLVTDGSIPSNYAFQEGKIYDDANAQYVAPWYKYRDEIAFPGEFEGDPYCTRDDYNSHNPNGWKYTRIEIDKGITYLGDWLFYRVSGPTELIIPNTVTELGDWAIRYSPTLKCIYLPDSVTTIGYRGCSRNEVATAIRLGNNLSSIGDFGLAQNSKVKYLSIIGNVQTMGENICDGNSELEYVHFENITQIGKNAFVSCPKLSKIDLPDTLTAIGNTAFLKTKLTSVKIPASVETIGTSAFYNCTDLKTVYIDSPYIASDLKYSAHASHIIANVERTYVKSDIEEVGGYFTNYCTKLKDFNGYALYVPNAE